MVGCIKLKHIFNPPKGYETSSTTLTYCMYELSVNEDIQAKARESVKDVLKKHGNKLTYESVNEMDYLEQCVNGKDTIISILHSS